MNKHVIASVIGGILMILGVALLGGAVLLSDGEMERLGTEQWETVAHSVTEDFDKISVASDTADIVLVRAEDGNCRVECYDRKRVKHSVSVENGTLCIGLEDSRRWYEYISFFSFGKETVTVYLPNAEYESLYVRNDTGDVEIGDAFSFGKIDIALSTGDVRCFASVKGALVVKASTGYITVSDTEVGSMELRTSTGDIKASGVACAGNVSVSVSTGRVSLTDVTCADLHTEGDTGDIRLDGVIASGSIRAERDTGDIYLDSCDAASIKIKTDTGDVVGTILTDKIFAIKTSTGRVSVPDSATGGACNIETDTGDIKIEIVK
ncbi:MAG: DUF4097 family beta strand repeat protein [Clostridia bacterium]|nr:DUF4097 family beta strand repeat protein [Clostridia bacterium]